MPGIIGIVSSDTKEEIEVHLTNMTQPMLHRNWYKVKKVSMENFGLSNILLEDDAVFSEKNSIVLTVTGEIFDQDKLRGKLSYKEPLITSLCDILLELYINEGVKALCGLNGLYIICIWERKKQKLTIINDRYGFLKLYYWFSNNKLLFTSECKSIVKHPEFTMKISELALSDLMCMDFISDDRTLFENIKLLQPASIMTYHHGQISLINYWDYQFGDASGGNLNENHFIDELAFKIQEAVRKRTRKNMCLFLTGGLDSRTIAGFLEKCNQDLKIRTVTIGHRHCYDVKFGRKIAYNLGYDHTFIPIDSDYIEKFAEEEVRRTEGAVSCYTSWIFASDSFLEENDIKNVMLGFLGDTLSGMFLPIELLSEIDEEKTIRYIFEKKFNKVSRDTELSSLLKPNIYKNIKGECFNSIRNCFKKANSDHVAKKYTYVCLHQRSRRSTSTHIDVFNAISEVLDPFTDNDLLDFMLSIPVEMKIDKKLYKKMIVKHLPKVASVRYTGSGMLLDVPRFKKKLYYWSNRIYNGIVSRIVLKERQSHDYKAYAHYNDWLRSGSKDFVMAILGNEKYLEDYFNMDYVNHLVLDHMEGKRNNFRKICALVTFSLWRKQFASGELCKDSGSHYCNEPNSIKNLRRN
jgi:asparagine synthase (glutamine-hydrolysing)